MDEMKYCKYCQTEHPITAEFWYFGQGKPKECKERAKHRGAAYNAANLERNRKRRREHIAKFRAENRELVNARARAAYSAPEAKAKKAAYDAKKYAKNKDRLHARERAKRIEDPGFRISCALRARLRSALRRGTKSGSAVRDLGCSIDELMRHLESKFLPGMTWDNHGLHGWHIDHIRPLSSFDLTDPEQLRAAVHFTNLQPLWAADNFRKSNLLSS